VGPATVNLKRQAFRVIAVELNPGGVVYEASRPCG